MKIEWIRITVSLALLLMLVSSATGLVEAQDPEPLDEPTRETTSETTTIHFDNLKRLSPDGNWLAYVTANDLGMSGSEIWISKPDGTEGRVVVRGNEDFWVSSPVWSPDSKRLAYIRVGQVPDSPYSVAPKFELWIIDITQSSKEGYRVDVGDALNPSLGYGGETEIRWEQQDSILFVNEAASRPVLYAVNLITNELTRVSPVLSSANKIQSQPTNVPFFWQGDPMWGSNQLGTCTGVTIAMSGCTLTSVSMVFKYFGVDVDPSRLNTWLTNHGGYVSGCALVWATAAHYAPSQISWVAKIRHADWDRLRQELDQGNPVIVGVKNEGHFVVVTGYSGNTYYINDPGRPDGEGRTLNDFGNGISSVNIYHASKPPPTPPTADAGGPYTANEGETVILDASGSSDPNGTIVSFEWDLDGDGEYDDATGQTPSWTWGDDYAGSIGLKVTDDDGDIGTDTTTVTISNVAPTVDAGPDRTVFRNDVVALSGTWTDPAGSLDELYSWTWDVTGDGITDNSGSASYGSVAPASTSFATEGTYTLTFAVTDKDGGAGSDSIVVEVLNRPPDCSVAAPSIETIWPPNHKFVLVNVLGVTDPEGDPVSITIDRIRQDEPVDTVGKGRLSPDGRGVGTDTAHVRAERMGTKKAPGNGRVYHIGFTADDGRGGSCSSGVLVGVPHDRRGTSPVDDGALYDSTALAP